MLNGYLKSVKHHKIVPKMLTERSIPPELLNVHCIILCMDNLGNPNTFLHNKQTSFELAQIKIASAHPGYVTQCLHFQKLKNPYFFHIWNKISFKNIEISFIKNFFHFYVDFRKIMAEKVIKNMRLFDFFSEF